MSDTRGAVGCGALVVVAALGTSLGCGSGAGGGGASAAKDGGVSVVDTGILPALDASPFAVTDPGDAQTPPMGAANVGVWLQAGSHLSWRCESIPSVPQAGLAHGKARVCSNALASGHGAGEYPVGAASVIELYDNADQLHGFGISRHIGAGAGAETWYWYLVMDGVLFEDGVATGSCSSCHAGAGQRGNPGHDYVFHQVR